MCLQSSTNRGLEMFDVGDFIFSPDLKSAYHHIVIFEELQQY
jgi:hypothetical protein